MTHRIYAKHLPYDDGHLGPVVEEMRLCGAPTVHCVRWRGELYALTSSHRLAACHQLELEPKVVLLDADSSADLDGFFEGAAASLPHYDFERIHLLEPLAIARSVVAAAALEWATARRECITKLEAGPKADVEIGRLGKAECDLRDAVALLGGPD